MDKDVVTVNKNLDVWSVRFISGYWRLSLNRRLVATFQSRGAAIAGMAVEKRRAAARGNS